MTEKQVLQKVIFLCRTIQQQVVDGQSSKEIIKRAVRDIKMLKAEARLNEKTGKCMKKLPPYGKQLAENIREGKLPKNDIYLTLGFRAWKAARIYALSQTVLLLPSDESPYHFEWPVTNLSVLLIDTGKVAEHLIKQTAHALLLAEASIVRAILLNGSLVIFRR